MEKSPTTPAQSVTSTDNQALADAYVYLLGRALVIRQEQTDQKAPGFDYNVIKYNPIGSADFVNPNFDVAYLEAWVAVDDKTVVLLEVPEIKGRYYTAQILDEWAEVITNINERDYPSHPHGKFALVAPGSRIKIPLDAVRIELHSHKAKLLGRVELKTDRDGAVALQKQFKLTPLGQPVIEPTAPMASFGNKDLIGVEIFDNADAVLSSAMDVSPVAARMQAKVRHISQQAKDPEKRKAFDKLIREKVAPEFVTYSVTKSAPVKNHWLAALGLGNYGSNYWLRTSASLAGIWANTNEEVVYFVPTSDADGQPLNGSNDYVLEFSAESQPDAVVNSYWSVILVDVPNYRVVPNALNRFNFNTYSGLKSESDGSLKILISSKPNTTVPQTNWLPAPEGKAFFLTLRTYVPKDAVQHGEWYPPALKRVT